MFANKKKTLFLPVLPDLENNLSNWTPIQDLGRFLPDEDISEKLISLSMTEYIVNDS